MSIRLVAAFIAASLLSACATRGPDQPSPDLIVVNARVVTGDAGDTVREAFAVRDGRFAAVGDTRRVQALAGPATRVIDAGGRTVLPGLIDGHIHMFRAGYWWKHEVRLDEKETLDEVLAAIAERARTTPQGTWILTLGGWHHSQLRERRLPTRQELDRVAPDHPVYIQSTREVGQMNGVAIRASGITAATKPPVGVVLGRDGSGQFDGTIRGFAGARYAESFFPQPGFEDKLDGLQRVMRDFNAAGLTSVGEALGLGVADEDYEVIEELARRGGMTLRMSLQYPTTNTEHALRWTERLDGRTGDSWLRRTGMGEIVTLATWDGYMPQRFPMPAQAQADLERIVEAGVRKGITFQFHVTLASSIDTVLDILERVHARVPLDRLRMTLLHAEDLTPAHVVRMKRLGMGVQMQNRQVLGSDAMQIAWGARTTAMPPVKTTLASGLPLASGTDGAVSSPYNPFIALWWLVTGRNARGELVRPDERLSRTEALRLYTSNAAWFSFEENDKGVIRTGLLADFLVLDRDYLTVPEDEIRRLKPVLTVVNGRVVHDAR